jgi:hypothetical protein
MASTISIPNLDCNFATVDQAKIFQYVIKCFEQEKNNVMDGKIVVNISRKDTDLTTDEIEIVKGIILANGHSYYEI